MIKVESKQDQTVKRDMDLPPVTQHRDPAMMGADYDILKAASQDIFAKDKSKHYDPYADFDPTDDPFKQDDTEKLSMRELMQKKLQGHPTKTEEAATTGESVEDRKARLKAQRDLILKKKQEERDKELQEARDGKSDNKYSNNLLKDLLALDKKVNAQEEKKKNDVDKKRKPVAEVLQVDDFDEEAEEIKPKGVNKPTPKKDMKSLFDSDDDEEELKKKADLKARQERQKQAMKQIINEEN